jgi:hypothetical protein
MVGHMKPWILLTGYQIFYNLEFTKKDDLKKTKRSIRHKWTTTGKKSPMVQGFPMERSSRKQNRCSLPPNGKFHPETLLKSPTG